MSENADAAVSAASDKLEALRHRMRLLAMAVEAVEDAGQRHALAAFAAEAEHAVDGVQAQLAGVARGS